MSEWTQLTATRWRTEVRLPIGWVIAEIQQRDALEWYEEHVEIHFADLGHPRRIAKRSVGAPTLAQAQAQCDMLIAELARMAWF
jgi:hypothetical protein